MKQQHDSDCNSSRYTLEMNHTPCSLTIYCELRGENIALLQQIQKELWERISHWPLNQSLVIHLPTDRTLDSAGLAWLLKLCRRLKDQEISYELLTFPSALLALASIYRLPLDWFGISSSATDF